MDGTRLEMLESGGFQHGFIMLPTQTHHALEGDLLSVDLCGKLP